MKTNFFASIALFLSAYAPLAVLFALRNFEKTEYNFKNPYFAWGSIVIAFFSVILLRLAIQSFRGQFHILAKSVKSRSVDLVNYSVPYLIAFFGVDFDKWQDIAALLLFMTVLFLLAYKTQTIFINPILALFNYGLYDVDFEENGKPKVGVFLSKIEMRRAGNYKVEKISQYLYIVTKEIEE